MEIAKPDAACRERLLRVYAARTELDLPNATTVVDKMDGVTASFVRELVRRAVLAAAEREGRRARITESLLLEVLDGFTGERQALTRGLLGG